MSNNDQQWPTGLPRADIEGLCKQLDYTFVDIPDLVYSGDEDDVEMSGELKGLKRGREALRPQTPCNTPQPGPRSTRALCASADRNPLATGAPCRFIHEPAL